jgi:hypothetical protein
VEIWTIRKRKRHSFSTISYDDREKEEDVLNEAIFMGGVIRQECLVAVER